MKFYKRSGGGVPFARKAPYEYQNVKYEADLKDGDVIKLLDSGTTEVGTYGEQNVFKVKTRNGEKKLSINQKTINVLVTEFGDESENWVNKDLTVVLKKDTIAGKKVEIVYLVTNGWKLDDYGDLIKEGATTSQNENEPEYPF